MTHRPHVLWLLSGLVFVVSLSGCSAPSPVLDQDLGDPSTLQPPTWHVGDQWNYVNDDKQWQNWTVEGREMRSGLESYRVRIQSEGPEYRTFNTTSWVHVESLGMIEFGSDEPGRSEWNTMVDPPGKQLFPLVNRTYESTWRSPFETMNQTVRFTVEDARYVEVPAGRFHAVLADSVDVASGAVVFHAWYSPTVGNYVSTGTFNAMQLESWHVH